MFSIRCVRKVVLATTLLLFPLTAAPEAAVSVFNPYNKPRAELARIMAHHNECRSWRCVRRVQAARHRRYIAHMRRTVRPYRGWLAQVAACESGGNYQINTGNGFFGGVQFALSSWAAVGGRGYPHLASKLEQNYRAVRLLHLQGRGAWPHCG